MKILEEREFNFIWFFVGGGERIRKKAEEFILLDRETSRWLIGEAGFRKGGKEEEGNALCRFTDGRSRTRVFILPKSWFYRFILFFFLGFFNNFSQSFFNIHFLLSRFSKFKRYFVVWKNHRNRGVIGDEEESSGVISWLNYSLSVFSFNRMRDLLASSLSRFSHL